LLPRRTFAIASRTSSSRPPLGLCFVFTLGLLPFEVNPPVLVWDAAASVLVVVVQLGRQDDRLELWLGFGASHATRVAGLSSVPPGVGNRPPNEHPASDVEKWQAACLRLLAKPTDDGVDILLAPVNSLPIHYQSVRAACTAFR
jgi:hypothetical protein